MRRMVCLTISLGLVAAAAAQDKLLKDPVEILKKADAATKAVKSVSYDAVFEGYGANKERSPRVKGSAIIGGGTKETANQSYFEAKIKTGKSDKYVTARIGTDGKTYFAIDPKAKKVKKGDSSFAWRGAGSAAWRLSMGEFMHPTPFTDETNADVAELKGVEKIGDEQCYKIYVEYAESMGKATWWFSTEDFLPRRVDRIGEGSDGEKSGTWLTLTNLVVSPKLSDNTFALNVPNGYEVEEVKAPERPKLLALGSKAPDWSLQTPGGDTVSLSKLRGSIVVLDFWAVWCGPCVAAMPHVQELHEKFKGKGVKIFGLNTWEREENDPVKFMKDKEYTYGLLLESDDVSKAYGVSGIPTFYVIDQNGEIALASSGYSPNDKSIEKMIEKLLEDHEG